MIVKQFEYEPLAHFSYALVSGDQMIVVDPERDPMPYYRFAEERNARIVGVFETHPHADFVSSHLQIHMETGATIYNSKLLGAGYPHRTFDEGDRLQVGSVQISALHTPGHSPDSITIVAEEDGKTVLFTGDTLFIGDIGRPDLREKAGNMKAKRRELADMMYQTIKNKFTHLPDDSLIYPAHGAGSLCGKNISSDKSSTLGNERMGNWAFKEQDKDDFIATLLEGQPFIPSYFGYDVDINKDGAEPLRSAVAGIPLRLNHPVEGVIVDVREASKFKAGHLSGSFNIQAASADAIFETWLGSIVKPKEPFHLVIDRAEDLDGILDRVAKIGYERHLEGVVTLPKTGLVQMAALHLEEFRNHPEDYTVVDIRNPSETSKGLYFEEALTQPLNTLRETAGTIPKDKPVVVHCAGGYRSAAGSSILKNRLDGVPVYDLGDAVKEFM